MNKRKRVLILVLRIAVLITTIQFCITKDTATGIFAVMFMLFAYIEATED